MLKALSDECAVPIENGWRDVEVLCGKRDTIYGL
jgi:hypothetical protein